MNFVDREFKEIPGHRIGPMQSLHKIYGAAQTIYPCPEREYELTITSFKSS
jgi:hypothetical protein